MVTGIAQSGYKLGCRLDDHGIRSSVPYSSSDVSIHHSLEPAYSVFHPSSYLGPEDDYAPLHAVEFKTAWSYTFVSPHILLA
jgi:hypothetical protein